MAVLGFYTGAATLIKVMDEVIMHNFPNREKLDALRKGILEEFEKFVEDFNEKH